ncbi:hypothetical protein DAT35_13385 [Vitiosangium sp. GDMCC 1.1324]|nr:hypothetical protein DAT35_13385 [Vitiosangium sp. GDMCC 1.1324]
MGKFPASMSLGIGGQEFLVLSHPNPMSNTSTPGAQQPVSKQEYAWCQEQETTVHKFHAPYQFPEHRHDTDTQQEEQQPPQIEFS